MRVLIIDDDIRNAIKKVIAYANQNELSLQDIMDTINGSKEPIGNNPNHSCIIPDGYRVVYSIENQPNTKCRHISISVDSKGALPNIEAVRMIIKEFGFTSDLTDGNSYPYLDINEDVINVIESID